MHEATGEAGRILWLSEIVFDNAPTLDPMFLVGDDRDGRELGLRLSRLDGLEDAASSEVRISTIAEVAGRMGGETLEADKVETSRAGGGAPMFTCG